MNLRTSQAIALLEASENHRMSDQEPSDQALPIPAFPTFHSLESGEFVGDVVVDDGTRHAADPAGLSELQSAGPTGLDGARGAAPTRVPADPMSASGRDGHPGASPE
jgi:hypothetical protein